MSRLFAVWLFIGAFFPLTTFSFKCCFSLYGFTPELDFVKVAVICYRIEVCFLLL